MTIPEKDVVRKQMCALCLAMPPFADGSRCQPHRIVRGKDGGKYIPENVIPLCPPCHKAVDRLVMITAARKGGLKGGLRVHELHPNLARETALRTRRRYPDWAREMGSRTGSKNIIAANASLTHAQRSANGKKGIRKAQPIILARKRRDGLTEKELAHVTKFGYKYGSRGGRARAAALSQEELSAIGRKGGLASGRWKKHRKKSY